MQVIIQQNMAKAKQSDSEKLVNIIIEGIFNKKGSDVVRLNLKEIPTAVSDYFVLCHGTSDTQVKAIADSVIKETLQQTRSKPWHKEGINNAEWILLDYVDVVVHIFKEEARAFYNLEDLWADADIKTYKDR